MIPFFDLHCDTLGIAYDKGVTLFSDALQASLSCTDCIAPYLRVGAIWSDYRYDNEKCFERYKSILSYAKKQKIREIKNKFDLNKDGYILAIEDVRLICDSIDRINTLKQDGVKIITPLWKDENQIGGAWNTCTGLTSFGKDVISKCISSLMIIDVSHASIKSFFEIEDLTEAYGVSFIASHSNAHSVCPHKRNLTDEQFLLLIKRGGIVGIDLVPSHLRADSNADITDVIKHIYHFLSLGGKNNICIGSDFDGTDTLPHGIHNISYIRKLYFRTIESFGKEIADKVFYKNALTYFSKNLL